MNQYTTRPLKLPRAVMLGGAMAVSAAGALGVAPTPIANATCASFFGIGNSANCTSTLTSIAIALGPNAQAHADGVLGAAISLGDTISATTGGMFNLAMTHGTNSSTFAGGVLSAAFAGLTDDTIVSAGSGPLSNGNTMNLAVVLGANSDEATNVSVDGVANVGVGFLSSGDIDAKGTGTVTVNSLGPLNNLTNHGNFSNVSSFLSGHTSITSTGTLSWAWDVIGANNTVEATGGASVAGALIQENETVIQSGPGINVRVRPTVGSSARANAKPAAATPSAADLDRPASTTSGTSKRGTNGPGSKARNRG